MCDRYGPPWEIECETVYVLSSSFPIAGKSLGRCARDFETDAGCHLAFNMAAPTSAVKFSDIYDLKEELGK